MQRVIERSGQSAYLLLCTMTDGKGVPLEKGERLGKVAEELEQAIRNSLRRGDMFTRYSDNQFLMLLLGIRAGGLWSLLWKELMDILRKHPERII